MTDRFTPDQMTELAASAVAKIDENGTRGATLCSVDEIVALAGVALQSGLLPPRQPEAHDSRAIFVSVRGKS
jgi:hypothetical protein